MKPQSLYQALNAYQNLWFDKFQNPFSESRETLERFQKLYLETESPFSRDQYPGHFTGSCFLLNPEGSEILLLHHRKLEKWLQMGGHCDGEVEMSQVALREAEEESGSEALSLLVPWIVDLDIHKIPARKDEPEHFHYDVRFLGICYEPEQIQLAENESTDLAWFPWERAYQVAKEPSMYRVFKKVEFLKNLNQLKG